MKIKISKSQWEEMGNKTGWIKEAQGYCPKCKSRLFPGDEEYMKATGVCSNCVTYDNTPDKRLRNKFEESQQPKNVSRKAGRDKPPVSICPSCGSQNIMVNNNKAVCQDCKAEYELSGSL